MYFVELFIIEKLFNDFVIKFECDIELFFMIIIFFNINVINY